MKFIRHQFDKLRPLFERGGKLEKLYPLFEAQETFLYVEPKRTAKGAHIRDPMDTKRLMSLVIVALLPALLFGIYNTGYQYYAAMGQAALDQSGHAMRFLIGLRYVLPIIVVSYAAGGVWEVLFAIVRKHEINEGFLVTGLLLPLIVPPTIPLWQVAIGVSFGVVIGKEVFGGTGMNVFNPALVARAFLFFAYPAQISGNVWIQSSSSVDMHAITGATPLLAAADFSAGAAAAGLTSQPVVQAIVETGTHATGQVLDYSLWNCFLGLIPGSIGETSTLMILIGAAILLITGVASWRIMAACVVGAVVTSLVMQGLTPQASHILSLPFWWHLSIGGFAFAVVFMATDPVSGSATNTGKWVYGFLIGMLTILIRAVNPAYPEGAMLAILFMNAFAPLVDYYVVQAHITRRLKHARVQ